MSIYTCPYCKTSYKLNWRSHQDRCFLNPLNIKLFARWLNKFVMDNSSAGSYALEPLVKNWDDFCKENDIIGVKWIFKYLGKENDIYDAICIILEHGVMTDAITKYDIKPEILYQYDSRMFLTEAEFDRRLDEFEFLENSLLNHPQ
jgi:hypothetical protein